MRRLLHFGPGNFARAFVADTLQEATGWEMTTVALQTPDVTDGLLAQDLAYTLSVLGEADKHIDVISQAYFAPRDRAEVMHQLCEPRTEVVTLTVTEKGYCLDVQGALDLGHPQIAADLEGPVPASVIGYLAHGLARRTAPITVLSCDNLSQNGQKLEAAVRVFQQAAGLTMGCMCTFASTMVDRIVPATSEEVRLATHDAWAVACEPFKEWVIETRLATPRPDWPGVTWVEDVAPYEMRKLRMLNGAHSYLAYAGLLEGYDTVAQAVRDPFLRAGAEALMVEAASTLPRALFFTAPTYARALLTRFENPHMQHRLRQIAKDGTQKLPQRLVETLRARKGQNSPGLVAALRAWIRYCQSETRARRAVEDPAAAQIASAFTEKDFLALLGAKDLTWQVAK